MNRRIKKYKTSLAVLSLFCVCFFIFSMYNFLEWEIKTDNTTEYFATIDRICIYNNGFSIYTNEIDGSFVVHGDVAEKISYETLNNLIPGTNIVFRVENTVADDGTVEASPLVVSLKTDSEEIFSLHDYNEARKVYMNYFGYMGLIVSSVFGLILIIVFRKYKAFLKNNVQSVLKLR